eukprot:gb/GECH01011638.1/.p1 GENE.gb/GECH01011638.1/~~gb/GECH01011638.1/.p1  ORF type:complete len:109 (+),score=34.68 gb/GECH01011638.1/:1-327(+)
MSHHGASLQNTNNELVKCIEEMHEQRQIITEQISREEEEKSKIEKDIATLTEKLNRLTESLSNKTKAKQEYDKTIEETEEAYTKIVDSSQTLLQVLKKETNSLKKSVS